MEIKTSESYKKEVLEKYKKGKGGEMSGYLAEPTRKKIREACLWLLSRRKEKNDEYILNQFFQFKEGKNKEIHIRSLKADKFVPVIQFLKGKTQETSSENLELISWLIDFKPRPLQVYRNSENKTSIEKTKSDDGQVVVDNTNEEDTEKDKEEEIKKLEERKKKKRRWFVTISISVAFGAILILFPTVSNTIFSNPPKDNIKPNQCMTWTKTHYEEVSCTKKFSSRTEPIDPIKLANFKKVSVTMATQFFTEDGNKPLIWYYKNKKREIEYFTAPGLHPVNGETLRKITEGIIEKYVPKHSSKPNSFIQ